jgi:signal transduction histidine kinase
MSRLIPQSLFGQTLAILLLGLVVSHAVGSWIYTADREQAVRQVGVFAAVQRMANLTRLVQEARPAERARMVAALSDPGFRLALLSSPPTPTAAQDDNAIARAVSDYLTQELQLKPGSGPLVSVSTRENGDNYPRSGGRMGYGPMGRGGFGHGPGMHGFEHFGGFRGIEVAMPLSEGQWLSFATAVPQSGPAYSQQFIVSMAVMAIIIVLVTIWAVRRVTAPLATLATAAERLGRDVNAPPLTETGTAETRQASRAFNEMQARLQSLIENRTRLLAAISHDLRTPLTLLRLRTESVENAQERDKMLATIAEMDSMIAATLRFARDEVVSEPLRPTDVTALLQSCVDDLADTGHAVSMTPSAPVVCDCRPAALKRALNNLLENAVKYGNTARTAIVAKPNRVTLTIDDDGPGIPEAELSRVFEPFYRLDESRNRDTGGIGLGLSIAKSILQTLGGDLVLSNRSEGGLRATVYLSR